MKQCRTCQFYKKSEQGDNYGGQGTCNRFPRQPVVTGIKIWWFAENEVDVAWAFPIMNAQDVCGEWKAREQ